MGTLQQWDVAGWSHGGHGHQFSIEWVSEFPVGDFQREDHQDETHPQLK